MATEFQQLVFNTGLAHNWKRANYVLLAIPIVVGARALVNVSWFAVSLPTVGLSLLAGAISSVRVFADEPRSGFVSIKALIDPRRRRHRGPGGMSDFIRVSLLSLASLSVLSGISYWIQEWVIS